MDRWAKLTKNRLIIAVSGGIAGFIVGFSSPSGLKQSPPESKLVATSSSASQSRSSKYTGRSDTTVPPSVTSGQSTQLVEYRSRVGSLLAGLSTMQAMPVCNFNDLTLNDTLASALGLSKEQVTVVNAALATTFAELAKEEVRKAVLNSDPNGDQVFEIPQFDGTAIRNNLQNHLEKSLEPATADILMGLFSAAPAFGRFGSHKQHVSVHEINGSVAIGPQPILLETIMWDGTGNVVGFNGGIAVSPEFYKARYGAVLDQLAAP